MLPKLQLDAHLMEQVLLNVIRNAMDAIGENGTITAKVQRSYKGWQLEIIDSGNALTPEVEYQIFTPFFTTKKTGQGIGLTLCAEILSRHNFDYSLAPGEDGKTHFKIEMPIAARSSNSSDNS